MALVGYAWVSAAEQDLGLQKGALAEVGCEEVYADQASGSKVGRPGLAEAFGHVRRGDTLVVWTLGRLGRSMSHLNETVRKLDGKGVGFRSLTGGVDTTIPGGTLAFHIVGALTQVECERTSAGLRTAEAHGRRRWSAGHDVG